MTSIKNAPPRVTSIRDLRRIPGVGPKIAHSLWRLGVGSVKDLKGADPEKLYDRLCVLEKTKAKGRALGSPLARGISPRASTAEVVLRAKPGARAAVDPCVLYVFRCAVYFASRRTPKPDLLKWWNWKDRKI